MARPPAHGFRNEPTPSFRQWVSAGTAFAAANRSMDVRQIDWAVDFQEYFEREEQYARARRPQELEQQQAVPFFSTLTPQRLRGRSDWNPRRHLFSRQHHDLSWSSFQTDAAGP